MKFSISFFALLILFSCSTGKGSYFNKKDIDLAAMVGTWQLKDQQKFEKWALVSPTECIGVSYDMSTGIATIDENLRMFKTNDSWIYEAKVKEHEFKPVQFKWTPDPMYKMRFVNDKNEFPQVVKYKINSDSTMIAEISDLKGVNVMKYDFKKVQKK
ncbi:MAG: hypothetical protein ABI851_06840 [Saprospiraceae bacterium]